MCIKTKAFKSFVFRTYAKQGEGGVEGISDQNSARALTSHRSLVTRHCFFSALIDLTPQEWNDGSVRLQQMRGQGLRLGTRKTEPARSTPRGLPASQSSDGWGIDSGVGHCIEIPDRNGASAPRRARFKRGMFHEAVWDSFSSCRASGAVRHGRLQRLRQHLPAEYGSIVNFPFAGKHTGSRRWRRCSNTHRDWERLCAEDGRAVGREES